MAPQQTKQVEGGSTESLRRDDSEEDEEDVESSSKDHSLSGAGSSFGSHTGSGSMPTTGHDDKASLDECSVTKQRSKHVNRSKFLVYLSLVAAAATVGSLTYIFTKKQETYTFQTTVRYRV